MKARTLLIVTFLTLLSISCTSQQSIQASKDTAASSTQRSKIEKIELKEQTRGTRRVTTLTPTSRIVSLNDDATTFPLSSHEWKTITEAASQVDLSKISTFQAPTTERFSDGALASSIFITANGKVHISSSFDAGAPPKELEKLYKMIISDDIGKKQ